MEQELLKFFDEDSKQIGVATRGEVHRLGYWHETFHCWFISKEKGTDYIYLQLRSDAKKDYPSLFDITAAGHILANETVQDGVREVKEELGIDVPFHKLVPLGVVHDCILNEAFLDNELANVFLYKCDKSFDDFVFQKEEVAGIVKVELNNFHELWLGKRDAIRVKGIKVGNAGNVIWIDEHVGRDQFVPHQISFFKTVIQKIIEKI